MMERRLSQMTDGDMIGVLDDDDSYVVGGRKATEFRLRAGCLSALSNLT